MSDSAYTFLSWVRQNAAAGLATADSGAADQPARGIFTAKLTITDGNRSGDAKHSVAVLGPGDTAGIEPGQIIRTYPKAGSTDAPPNFLALVEFDRPDLPWLFTPVAPNGTKLRPWICLLVVEKNHSRLIRRRGLALPVLGVSSPALLPPLDESHLWAHAQVAGPRGADPGTGLGDGADPRVNLSRLLSPRRLQPITRYRACVVPTFEAGRQAGLGQTVKEVTLKPAWTAGAAPPDLPVYFSFEFTTGETGDFEMLARRLRGFELPKNSVRRALDVRAPIGLKTGAVTSTTPPEAAELTPEELATLKKNAIANDAVVEIESALRAPGSEQDRWPMRSTSSGVADAIVAAVNLVAAVADDGDEDPWVGPPLYGSGHAQQRQVAKRAGRWIDDLNRDPRYRVAAGVGARVVQAEQEALMAEAWRQLDEIRRANEVLDAGRFGRAIGRSLHVRHFSKLSDAAVVQVAAPALASLPHGEGTTARAAIFASALPDPVVRTSLRRMLRPDGPIERRAHVATLARGTAAATPRRVMIDLGALSAGRASLFSVYKAPDGTVALRTGASRFVDEAHLGQIAAAVGASATESSVNDILSEAGTRAQAHVGRIANLSEATIRGATLNTTRVQALATQVVALERPMAVVTAAEPPSSEVGDAIGPLAGVFREQLLQRAERAGADALRPADRAFQIFRPNDSFFVRNANRFRSRLRRRDEDDDQTVIFGRVERESSSTLVQVNATMLTQWIEAQPAQASTSIVEATRDTLARSRAWVLKPSDAAAMPARPDLPLRALRDSVVASLNPRTAVAAAIKERTVVSPSMRPADADALAPIAAAPQFHAALWRSVERLSKDWILAGVDRLVPPNKMCLAETNPEFVEAVLVGANHEFMRELLWRGYPTDMRGTSFRSFWGAAVIEAGRLTPVPDIIEIHRWSAASSLGTHAPALGGEQLVLVVKGDLIRRFPDVLVYATQTLDGDVPTTVEKGLPLFRGNIAPDVLFAGFALSPDAVRDAAAGWWIVIAEAPTAPRFGFDEPDTEAVAGGGGNATPDDDWDWVTWNDVLGAAPDGPQHLRGSRRLDPREASASAAWGASAAQVARIAFQQPARVALNATKWLQ